MEKFVEKGEGQESSLQWRDAPFGSRDANTPSFFDGALSEERGTGVRRRIKKSKFRDRPLSNFDLENWCEYLNIPVKGIFSRDRAHTERTGEKRSQSMYHG